MVYSEFLQCMQAHYNMKMNICPLSSAVEETIQLRSAEEFLFSPDSWQVTTLVLIVFINILSDGLVTSFIHFQKINIYSNYFITYIFIHS